MQSNTGAENLVRTLVAGGVEVCFANPGTSEMHFVSALDRIPGMRCVLGLFEGVVTGAADGYARMTDRPACTLLHLAPGLANGLANLHNARRAQSPIVNIVGEHRQGHKAVDSPLTGDIEALARPHSDWMHTCGAASEIARDAAAAIREARSLPGKIATLILPADTAWEAAPTPEPLSFDPTAATLPSDHAFQAACNALRSGEQAVLVLGGRALRAPALEMASRIAVRTGATILAPHASARIERGAGRVGINRTPVPVDAGLAVFRNARHVILVGAKLPTPLFGYPDKPDHLLPPGANLVELTNPGDDMLATLSQLAERLHALGERPRLEQAERPGLSIGPLTADAVLQVVAAYMPESCIIVDESITAGRSFFPVSRGVPPHDYLQLTGGAIGCGIPVAAGAALACPDRKVINLEGDGSAMYTIQGLWTQARERLDVLTIVFANRGYQILKGELKQVGAMAHGLKAEQMLTLDDPGIRWVELGRSLGVESARASTVGELRTLVQGALGKRGPFLIEACLQ